MTTDRITIGVTKENREFLEGVRERGLFNDHLDAAKLGLSLAIRASVAPGQASGTDTMWNVGTFDKDGHVRTILGAFYPETTEPYRLAEHLMNEGLVLLKAQLATNPELDMAKLQESLSAEQ